MSDALVAWITGLSAIVLAAAGVSIAVREVRRKERRDCRAEVAELERLNNALQSDLTDWHTYTYGLRVLLADHGVTVPNPPAPDEVGVGDVGGRADSRRRVHRLRHATRDDPDRAPDDREDSDDERDDE